jgi:hypothetical protein
MSELRPADMALFLLASGALLPRKRARDQQADLAGLALKRRALDLLVAYDPEPGELERCLAQIVEELGPPSGPARAICAGVRDEWEQLAATPGMIDWLVIEALREGQGVQRRKGRRDKGTDR